MYCVGNRNYYLGKEVTNKKTLIPLSLVIPPTGDNDEGYPFLLCHLLFDGVSLLKAAEGLEGIF